MTWAYAKIACVVGAVASLTCSSLLCPSMWLTITKGDPAPRPVLPPPVVADPAIVIPEARTNRFDVIAGAPEEWMGFPAFTEAPTSPSRFTDADAARTELLAKYGHPAPIPVDVAAHTWYPAHTEFCLKAGCSSFWLDKWPLPPGQHPQLAIIKTGTDVYARAIVQCQPRDTPVNTPPGCFPDAGKTNVAIASPFPKPPGPDVQVAFDAMPRLATPMFSFIHVSDIQIRDGDVHLENRDTSHRLDWLIQSFEYDPDLEYYNPYVVQALFATINGYVAQLRSRGAPAGDIPSLVIHTGDAIDSGVTSELAQFHHLVHELHIPFFDVLGNHDMLSFGNLIPLAAGDPDDVRCTSASAAAGDEVGLIQKHPYLLPNKLCLHAQITCPSCLPGEAALVARPDHPGSVASFVGGLQDRSNQPVPTLATTMPGQVCGNPGEPIVWQSPGTRNHGFDLENNTGYYAFAMPVTTNHITRNLWFIAMDTNDLPPATGGSSGAIGPTQQAWLDKILACVQPSDLVLVFGHHNLANIRSPAFERALVTHKANVIAYLYGHEHVQGICRDRDAGPRTATACRNFWEIETGSIIEFPQEARLIRLEDLGGGIGFLDLIAFREKITHDDAFTNAVRLGERGAERDYCRTHDIACSDDLRVYRNDGRHTHARLFFRLP